MRPCDTDGWFWQLPYFPPRPCLPKVITFSKARQHWAQNDYNLAITCFTEAIRLNPNDAKSPAKQGRAAECGSFEEAIRWQKEAIKGVQAKDIMENLLA